jgi:hypothetical protein
MKKVRIFIICLLVLFLSLIMIPRAVKAQGVYGMSFDDVIKHKAVLDDPRPIYKELSYDKILPAEVYKKMTFDVGAMKTLWAEVVGFRAPDEVGKIAPEIKPGTYTYQDKEKYAGFKELLPPILYDSFKPGGPPHAGNFPEIKIVPTRQYYWALPIAEATKKNMAKTKLDAEGYLVPESYVSGYPFPKPSGPFKAQQVMYNWEKRYYNFENSYVYQFQRTWTKNLRIDYEGMSDMVFIRLHGRVLTEPFGWLDGRAKDNQERKGYSFKYMAPRDMYGNALTVLSYLDPNKFDLFLLYINALRRIRRMSATDSQDDVGGGDIIYEDVELFDQKLTPKRFPYRFEVIAEREYLMPAGQLEGSLYFSSKGGELRNIEFERRPMYVIKLTELDKNFVYSKRILYIDKETFWLYHIENYDQKGRLYRSVIAWPGFTPEMGVIHSSGYVAKNHIDWHSALVRHFVVPDPNLGRDDIDLQALIKKGK